MNTPTVQDATDKNSQHKSRRTTYIIIGSIVAVLLFCILCLCVTPMIGGISDAIRSESQQQTASTDAEESSSRTDVTEWSRYKDFPKDVSHLNVKQVCNTSYDSRQATMFVYCFDAPDGWRAQGGYENRQTWLAKETFQAGSKEFHPALLVIRRQLDGKSLQQFVQEDIDANIKAGYSELVNHGYFDSSEGRAYILEVESEFEKGEQLYSILAYYKNTQTDTLWFLSFTVPLAQKDEYRPIGLHMMESFELKDIDTDYDLTKQNWIEQ